METCVLSQASDCARQLFEAHCDKAIAEAAQKAAAGERKGEKEQAKVWRRVEGALKEMTGPHQP
jgi:hypothetical protein